MSPQAPGSGQGTAGYRGWGRGLELDVQVAHSRALVKAPPLQDQRRPGNAFGPGLKIKAKEKLIKSEASK